MYAKIYANNTVGLFLSETVCKRGCTPVATSSGHKIEVKDLSTPRTINNKKYRVTVYFTHDLDTPEEVTIITMEAIVTGYMVEDGANIINDADRMYYMDRDKAEKECKEGKKVGFINTWNNDCYNLSLGENGKIIYRRI